MALDQTLVLVVDDDLVSRELLSLLLTHHEYTAKAVASGAQALEYLQTCRDALPRAILADLQMPGISGATLAKALREVCGAGTVLVAISGSSPDEAVCRNYDAFLLKPFTIDEFMAVIANRGVTNSAPPATSEEVPALNPEVYAKLSASMSPQKLEQLFTLCLEDIAGRIVSMREAASAGNETLYKREAHAIKGGCGMIGATELQRLATTMETNGLAANHVATFDEFLVAQVRLKRMLNARETATM